MSALEWQIQRGASAIDEDAEAIAALWNEDPYSHPFTAPGYLSVAAHGAERGGFSTLVAKGYLKRRLAALWPLKLGRDRSLEFLQTDYRDYTGALASSDVSAEDLAWGLAKLIEAERPSRALFHSLPEWGPTLSATRRGLGASGWHATAFAAWPNPILFVAEPDSGGALVNEINRHKRVKTYDNKLARCEGFAFEVTEDGRGLDDWIREFCENHEMSWYSEYPFSRYRHREWRDEFKRYLEAWLADRVLVLFAICAAGHRIAQVVALKHRRRLLYLHPTFSPVHHRTRCGHVLIRRVGLWMAENGYEILDFGNGDESYKYRYANNITHVWRVFGSSSRISVYSLRGGIEKRIRASKPLQKLWDEVLNGRIRIGLLTSKEKLARRLRAIGYSLTHNLPSHSLVRIRDKLLREREIFYGTTGAREPMPTDIVPVSVDRIAEAFQDDMHFSDGQRVSYLERIRTGVLPFGVVDNGRLVAYMWVGKISERDLPPWLKDHKERVWCLWDGRTHSRFRGKGYYPMIVSALARSMPAGDIVLVYANDWNVASHRGVGKAGFAPFAARVTGSRLLGRRVDWHKLDRLAETEGVSP